MRKAIFYISVAGLAISLAAAVFFFSKVRESDRYVEGLIEAALPDGTTHSPVEAASALSNKIFCKTHRTLDRNDLAPYDRWESVSFFNVTSAVSLKYGGYGIKGHSTLGACGTMSRTLLTALHKLDIPARKLQLLGAAHGEDGHTLVEFLDGDRWLVISPSDSSFVWRKDDGQIATAEEIKRNDNLFASIYSVNPRFPYRFDNYSNIRWAKLPRRVTGLIKFVIGEKRFNEARTPTLYDTPRTLFLFASLSFSLVFAVVGIFGRPRRVLSE